MNILEIKNIVKQYPGSNKKANNDISLDLKKGEILCIAGENGAGKTTLMKILCGLEKQDSGLIIKNGNIGMVHQHFMLFPEYTTAENIVMGNEPYKYGVFLDKKKANEIAQKIISSNNFSIKNTLKVKDLTLGEMQQVEICRILYSDADIIILDEPTSILTEFEIQSLFKTLKFLAGQGKSIILITHKLHEIKQIADRIAVLRNGKLACFCAAQNVDENEIARLMMGTEQITINKDQLTKNNKQFEVCNEQISKPVLSFVNVTVCRAGQKRPLLDDVSFSVSSGEVLGFAGVGGNGLGVIEAVLGGFLHPLSGKILHRGKDISKLSIRALRKQGLAYVPADRIRVASAQDASIEENLIITKRDSLNKKSLRKMFAQEMVLNYNIETSNLEDKAKTLSGGNLQKLILAREINNLNDYIVFSEPAWGLDIASSRFIMNKIIELRNKGAAVILISTNLDEVIELSDRVIVMYGGKIAKVFETVDETMKEEIGRYMTIQKTINNDEKEKELVK